jgi:cytosine/uracil/thiamine/allantoin permease
MTLRETLHTISKTIEVKPTEDEYEKIETTRWGNRDTYPIPSDKRTYGVYAYMAYWGELTPLELLPKES